MTEKTTTELMFEAYLTQRRLTFDYEPYGPGERNPDYRFRKQGKLILVEVEEFKTTPLDRATHGVSPGSLDPREAYDLIRRRIKDASKQLKPHKDEVDHCVVILGKKSGSQISMDEIFYAMFGDPYFSIPINPQTSVPASTVQVRYKPVGALLKNKPKTREPHFVHRYISAVGLIREFNGLEYYKTKLFTQFLNKTKSDATDFGTRLKRDIEWFEKIWPQLRDRIPRVYRDSEKMLYRVDIIINPLSDNPLPERIFNGRWDHVRAPKVIYEK